MAQESLNINPSQEAELKVRQEAAELLTALKEKEGKKALVLVVDDESDKRRKLGEFFTAGAANRDSGYVLSLKQDGASAIRLYQAFREQDLQENPTKVVAVLDGSLDRMDRRYRYGKQVAGKLLEVSAANGWEAPYLVGASSDDGLNRELQNEYPDQYVGKMPFEFFVYGSSAAQEETDLFDAINSKLEPPQK